MDAEERLPERVENEILRLQALWGIKESMEELRAAIREGYHEAFQRGQRDGESR